jgi:hypothetical protein
MITVQDGKLRRTGRVSLAHIDAVVASHLGPARVKGNAQPAVFNRQVAMYLAKQLGRWSTTRIGKFYNGRDHSTVHYAIRRIEALRQSDAEVAELVGMLAARILSNVPEEPHRSQVPLTRTEPVNLLTGDQWLDQLADKIAERLLSRGGHVTAGITALGGSNVPVHNPEQGGHLHLVEPFTSTIS